MSITPNREDIEAQIALGDAAGASQMLVDLWTGDPSPSTAAYMASKFELISEKLNLVPYRVAILRSFTVEPIVPLLRALAYAAGLDLTVYLSDFNAHAQEVLDAASALYSFRPDAVFLAVQTRDVAPELWRDFADLSAEQLQAPMDRVLAEYGNWIRSFRSHSNAHLIIHNLEQPSLPSTGILDSQTPCGQSEAVQHINRELRGLSSKYNGVYVLDYDALVARHGRMHWGDERKWLTVRLPIAAPNLPFVAKEWMRFLHPLTGKTAKAVVVDLDNTLWGGVIGEDGRTGIKLGNEYPGAAFRDVQRALLDLHRRGILLAICSKNNPDDAMEALQSHPEMLLRPDHFACMRINWTEKSQNLREIAQELNIGVDSLAFVDDNPIERQQVRSALPEVHVINLPNDPMQFARVIREAPIFERLSLSTEDRQRGEMYKAQSEREQLQMSVSSREDFFRSLQQEVEILPVTKATLPRVAQLTNKTNQFNLTTRRYTEQQIAEMAASEDHSCFSIRVKDRFGDNGLVGVALTHREGEDWEIDTFLLSCRVIGRTVETAFLSFLADHARKNGARRLRGWFYPTKKNAPAKEFYKNHGFAAVEQSEAGTLWSLDLTRHPVACPEWVKLHISNGDKT
jgi:FkbH-like protein